jgi:hypothetical protein
VVLREDKKLGVHMVSSSPSLHTPVSSADEALGLLAAGQQVGGGHNVTIKDKDNDKDTKNLVGIPK